MPPRLATVARWCSGRTTRPGGGQPDRGQGGANGETAAPWKPRARNAGVPGVSGHLCAERPGGHLLLDPQDITIVSGSGGANDSLLSDNVIGAAEPDTTTNVTISSRPWRLSGNVTLSASRDVILSNLSDNLLYLSSVTGGSTFTIAAGRDIIGNGRRQRPLPDQWRRRELQHHQWPDQHWRVRSNGVP